jgi:hypothetical protein
MGSTEIQKQTMTQCLRNGISVRAIAAEVGVNKGRYGTIAAKILWSSMRH